MNTSNITTRLIAYYLDLTKPEEAEVYKRICADLKAKGLHKFATYANSSTTEYREFRAKIDALNGGPVELETAHIFNDQWNTAPIFGGNGLRVFDWAESIFDNKKIKSGYYLDQTSAMVCIRRNTNACGYCGHQEAAQKGNVFCPCCIGSEYLKATELHLTRMVAVVNHHVARAELSEAEKEHLMPLYVNAQIFGNTERDKARKAKERADILAKRDKAIANATTEYEGFTWLMDKGVSVSNLIYYSHTGRFCIGWRAPLDKASADAVSSALVGFPFPLDIKTN